MRRVRRVLVMLLLAMNVAQAAVDDDEAVVWAEGEVSLPTFPADGDLIEFYVSAVTANRFFIDAKSLSAGSDGVVRYVLVVTTAGGATNVTFEGIHCSAREFRIYSTGRIDRSWGALRPADWRRIENKTVNRHHAALSRDYFCPGGSPIQTADEGRDALRRGKHPQAD
ncbi:MAG: CNP1-like family protein [Gammaproteobacteria bacterium]|nr:CNP1-like family protein [Gammaproteobacteria bacterium]MBU1645700.1 CNP1-like family protein [Gammaproteobacteria bacterium]MBU1970805.1 CNP1-like family protein [Gammaproteobacteria bacterium]